MSVLPEVIDVHAHTTVARAAALVEGEPGHAAEQAALHATFGPASSEHNRRLAEGPYVPLLNDVATRLASMDGAGIGLQVVSVIPTQYHYWAAEELSRRVVGAINEHLAALVAQAPRRLVGLASVALQHPELAASQLEHAVIELGLRGAEICTTAAGRELSDPAFEPLWAAAEDLGALVFVHPWGCSLGERLASFYLGNVVGNPVETTLALSHLVFGGVLDRHPRLRVCAAHGGGYFPHYLGRADHAWRVRPESHTCLHEPSSYLERLWFDSLVYRPDTLAHLIEVAGAGQVVLGTDYPFDMSEADPLGHLGAVPGLDAEDRSRIAGRNAAALLWPARTVAGTP